MYLADLHIHSRYSIATGRQACLEAYHHWARIKGIRVVGSGDFTHPRWLAEIREKLEPLDNGFFRFRDEPAFPGPLESSPAALDVQFCLSAEISSIYKKQGKTRKIHSLIFAPSLEVAARIRKKLATLGNIASDGRPILGVEAKQLLELVLEISPRACLVPAHVWTPWFALFGSKSGFDRIEDCFEELTKHIFALETGLSSDPAMNWRWSALDRYALISNSDAHSPSRVGREANIFDTDLSYDGLFGALKSGQGFLGTCEFFPQEGKYHLDGHRGCGVCLEPEETLRLDGLCPVCGRTLTVGVLHRVLECADRGAGARPRGARDFRYHIPLPELLSELSGRGPQSKTVQAGYGALISAFGSEFSLLFDVPAHDIARYDPLLAEAVERMRSGRVETQPGFDGQFGVIRAFRAGELERLRGQSELFVSPAPRAGGAGAQADAPGAPGRQKPAAATAVPAGKPAATKEQAAGDTLNERQRELLASRAPVLRVCAGPGTGKTHLLIAWIADLVRRGEAAADQILAVTFTNKAALQMRERLRPLLGPAAAAVTVSTIHALCYALLREADPELEQIIDEQARGKILALLAPELSRGEIERRSRDLGQELEADVETAGPGGPGGEDLKNRYLEFLSTCGGVDLAALVSRAVKLLKQDTTLAAAARSRFRAVAVDEFQDINPAQYCFLKLLFPPPLPGAAPGGRRLLVIGDPNQSIYAFRGSEPRLFDDFSAEYPARDLMLTRSYRCPPTVLKAAHSLIAHNPGQTGSGLEAVNRTDSLICLVSAPSPREEGRFIAGRVEQLVGGTRHLSVRRGEDAPYSFADIAVLTRTHRVSRAVLPYLSGAGIPVSIGRHASLLSEPPLEYLKSVLRLMANPCDAGALQDICANLLKRLSPDRVRDLCLAAPGAGKQYRLPAAELLAVLAASPKICLSREQACELSSFAALLGEAEALRESRGVAAVLELLGKRLLPDAADPAADPAAGAAAAAAEAAAADRALALAQIIELAAECGADLRAFLRRVELSIHESEGACRPEHVSLLTFHAAKGLEFPVVFIAGAEDYLTAGEADLEEERRLFYVALTRARDRVIITRSQKRRHYGQIRTAAPSPFLAEIPPFCLEGGTGQEIHSAREGKQLSLFS
jgi:DNA helicase-2/ATP-dependent DNA helicase PcrA